MTRGKRAYEDVEDTNDVQEWSGRERRSHRGVRVLPKKTKVSIRSQEGYDSEGVPCK